MAKASVSLPAPRAVGVVGFLVATVVLFAMVTGCGGSSEDTPEEAVSPPAETPLELLQRSNQAMANIGSFRARTTIEGTSMGQEIEVSVVTDVGENQWTHTRMSVEGPDGEAEVEQVLTGQHAYTRFSGQGTTWARMDLGALAEAAGLPTEGFADPVGFYDTLFPAGDIPWGAYSVKSAGLRRIFGVKTEHLEVDLDFEGFWAALNPQQKQEWQELLAPDLNSGEVTEQFRYESIDIWIDVSGYVRQLELAISAGDDTSLEVGMVLTDFGEQIDIEEPEEYVDV